MVVLEGDSVEQIVLRGPGAFSGTRAVMSDVIDIARGTRITTFGQPATSLTEATSAQSATPAPYYIRATLQDKPGALAKVAAALGEAGVSIDRMRQYGHDDANDPCCL